MEEHVWVPDEQEVFVLATVQKRNDDGSIDVKTNLGEAPPLRPDSLNPDSLFFHVSQFRTLPPATVLTSVDKNALGKMEDDLVHLQAVNEPSILHTLEQRFNVDRIYVRLNCNPFLSQFS